MFRFEHAAIDILDYGTAVRTRFANAADLAECLVRIEALCERLLKQRAHDAETRLLTERLSAELDATRKVLRLLPR